MPIIGRLEMLKLRYFWKLHHTNKDSLAHSIYAYKRKNFLESNVGFVHEVFNLCCKFGRMDIGQGVCPKTRNPYTMIKNIVESYYYARNVETARKTQKKTTCAHTSPTVFVSCGNPQNANSPTKK